MFAVAVHAGAGFHAYSNEVTYKELCTTACEAAANVLKNSSSNTSAIDAAVAAVCVLEDSSLTNAGYGSCLTLDGHVECDAGLMCGQSLQFSSIGSLRNTKNPINVAHRLLQEHLLLPPSSIGRIKPISLCGDGARKWASDIACLPVYPEKCLISQSAMKKWNKYRKLMHDFECADLNVGLSSSVNKRLLIHEDGSPYTKRRFTDSFDTVGAVCMDSSGNVCSAASSGGIPMKLSGRIGQACVYGCGCWAEMTSEASVGCVTSGTGEQLIKTQLAQKVAESILSDSDSLLSDVVKTSFRKNFLNSRFLNRESTDKFGAVIGILRTPGNENLSMKPVVEFFFTHSTESLAYAFYADGIMKQPKFEISRKNSSLDLGAKYYAFRCK